MIVRWRNELRLNDVRAYDHVSVALGIAFPEWRLAYVVPVQGGRCTEERFMKDRRAQSFSIEDAYRRFYVESYYRFLSARPDDLDFLCAYGEVSGDEAADAIRAALRRLGRVFFGPKARELRLKDADGARFRPEVVPFFDPRIICQPSLAPEEAERGSIADFWASNLWGQTPVDDGVPSLE